MSYYTGLGAFAQGVAKGLDQYKQDTKETEQRTYDRNRQSVADQQSAESHTAQIKNNDQTFKFNSIKLGQAQRDEEDAVKKRDGQQHFAKLYGMYANDNLQGMIDDINPRIQPALSLNGTQQMKYDLNPDGTISLNLYDPKDPTKPIRTRAANMTKEDLFGRARAIYDPEGAIETKLKSDYENAKAVREQTVDDYKAKRDHGYKVNEIGAQNINARDLEEYKQGQANLRTRIQQEGKGVPVAALKAINDNEDSISNIDSTLEQINSTIEMLDNSKLEIGPMQNLQSEARNAAGYSNENSQNYERMRSSIHRFANTVLLEAKGVQTDGDAKRAYNQIIAMPLTDAKAVGNALADLKSIFERTRQVKQNNVQRLYNNHGQTQSAPSSNSSSTSTTQPNGSGISSFFD